MIAYFDKDGEAISKEEWETLKEDPTYVLVDETTIMCPEIDIVVRTFWRGTAGHYGPNGPEIFCTQFTEGKETSFVNYATREEAQKGHDRIVETNTDDHAVIPRWKQVGLDL